MTQGQNHPATPPRTPPGATTGVPGGAQAVLSEADVRKVATLARLALSDDEVRDAQQRLTGVLALMQRLRDAHVEAIEPLRHVTDAINHMDADIPGETLPRETLERIAPDAWEGFVRVPKVLGEGGGA